MKKLLVLLFSLFLLSSPSVFADDISDFQIEGMSIGDSLLDYMTKEEILKEIELNKNDYYYLNEPNKYVAVYLWKHNSSTYDGISFFIKNNSSNKYITSKNKKYIIHSVRGMIDYIEDFDSCLVKRDEIVEVLSEMFPNADKDENVYPHPADFLGDSIKNDVYFLFDSGDYIEASCDNFEETLRIKNNWSEGLNIVIKTSENIKWLGNHK